MKKIILSFLLLTCAFSGFSQSFSVDSQSLSVPRYANQTAITTAIPSPTVGMLVYNNSLNHYAYWNGTAWTSISTGAAAGPALWSQSASNFIQANTGLPNGIEILRMTMQNNAPTFSSPTVDIVGANSSMFRYRNVSGSFSLTQESATGFSIAASSMVWKYYDGSPTTISTNLFGYGSSNFNVYTGGLNVAAGNATIGGNFSATGTSGLTGKVTVGSSTATTAGVEIRSQTSTDANPDIYFKGTNNVLRFGNNVDGTSLVQTSLSNNTPTSASIAWKHISNANPAVSTPMMSLQGDGDLTVNGFTQLGADATTTTAGVTRSSPAMKTILLTGNIAAGATVYTTTVPHGLTAAKIVEVKVLVSGLSNFIVSDDFVDNRTVAQGAISGYQFATFTDATNVYILRHQTNGSNINNANGLVSTFRILITYIP
jgi:hypothetical protein